MEIGKLYQVKKYFWLVFPLKETATIAAQGLTLAADTADGWIDRLSAAGIPESALYASEDLALQACEDALLVEVLNSPWQEPPPLLTAWPHMPEAWAS